MRFVFASNFCSTSNCRENGYTVSRIKKMYWGKHFFTIIFGCWSTGSITDKMVSEYLEHHLKYSNNNENFILEKASQNPLTWFYSDLETYSFKA